MTRPRAGLHRGKRRVARLERARVAPEAVDAYLVEAEVWDVHEAVGRIEVDRVRPRRDRRHGGGVRSCVLDERRSRLQRPVPVDREDGRAAASVVGNEDVAASLVNDEVDTAPAPREDIWLSAVR